METWKVFLRELHGGGERGRSGGRGGRGEGLRSVFATPFHLQPLGRIWGGGGGGSNGRGGETILFVGGAEDVGRGGEDILFVGGGEDAHQVSLVQTSSKWEAKWFPRRFLGGKIVSREGRWVVWGKLGVHRVSRGTQGGTFG